MKDDINIDVGEKIRNLRKSKKLSIANLSENTGLSVGLISQIERNKVVPSIKAMWRIANSLEVNIGYFFEEINEEDIIVRKEQRKQIQTNDSTKIYELLMPDLVNKNLELLLITLKNETKQNKELVNHEGEECGYIIKGKMKLIFETKEYILEEGDSFYFKSNLNHIYENYNKDEECVLICAMTPPSF
ncbi:cupin domain-containing protein [Intestinibacter sp.]